MDIIATFHFLAITLLRSHKWQWWWFGALAAVPGSWWCASKTVLKMSQTKTNAGCAFVVFFLLFFLLLCSSLHQNSIHCFVAFTSCRRVLSCNTAAANDSSNSIVNTRQGGENQPKLKRKHLKVISLCENNVAGYSYYMYIACVLFRIGHANKRGKERARAQGGFEWRRFCNKLLPLVAPPPLLTATRSPAVAVGSAFSLTYLLRVLFFFFLVRYI